jgi:hypothetical protein
MAMGSGSYGGTAIRAGSKIASRPGDFAAQPHLLHQISENFSENLLKV